MVVRVENDSDASASVYRRNRLRYYSRLALESLLGRHVRLLIGAIIVYGWNRLRIVALPNSSISTILYFVVRFASALCAADLAIKFIDIQMAFALSSVMIR